MKAVKNMVYPLLAAVIVFSAVNIYAQQKEKSGLDKKLAELKGNVEKVTVKVDGKDVVFEGKEAETLVKKMKSGGLTSLAYSVGTAGAKSKAYTIITKDGEDLKEGKVEAEDVMVTLSGDGDEGELTKKIKVEKIDGKMTLTVVDTDKDGKKVEKVLEGEEAEKYLKENNEGIAIVTGKAIKGKVPTMLKIVKGKPLKTVVIEKDDDDEDDTAEATIYITKADKAKKNVIIKKMKTDVKKENKED